MRSLTHNALRIVAGLMLWQHGAQKLFGWLGGFGREPGGTVDLFSIFGLAGVLEFFGGALILLGLFTRPVGFLLAGEMAVTFFWRHLPNGFWPIQNRGELPVLFCFIFLFLMAAGGGSFSLDHLLRRRSGTALGATEEGEAAGAE